MELKRQEWKNPFLPFLIINKLMLHRERVSCMKKKIILLLVFCCLSVILTGCNTSEKNQTSDEKIVLTALYWKELPEFEALVESTYTDIDLQIERSTSAVYNSDIQRRLKNGHGTDLVFTSIPNGEILNFMLDLSANSFSNRFASATMEIIEQDGKMYFLPLPSLYRGGVSSIKH